jgi:chromosome segregation ATPase
MKSISTLLLLIFVSCMEISAQKQIIVSEDSINFGKTRLPGLFVTIPEVNYEIALKTWIRDLQSGTKSKVVTENGQMSIFGAKIKEIDPSTINVYSNLMNLDSMLKLRVAFEIKKDQYVEKASGEVTLTKTKTYLKEFAKNLYIEVAKDQADAEDKKLREIQRELSSLEREKTSLQKSIQSNNSDIISEKEKLIVENNELTTVSAEIIEQNKQMSSMEASAVTKEKTDYIKALEKRKKKALSTLESSQNKITKANSEIDKANLDIVKNQRMQEQVTLKVENQQAVYQKFADKLKVIRSY